MPIEKIKYAPRGSSYTVQEKHAERLRAINRRAADRLIENCRALMMADEQDQHWQANVADDLNTILTRLPVYLRREDDPSDVVFARALLRIVARVAEFEGIRRTK